MGGGVGGLSAFNIHTEFNGPYKVALNLVRVTVIPSIAGVLQFGAKTGGFQETEDSSANHKENGE